MKKNEKLKKHIKNKYYKKDLKVISLHIDDEKELYNTLDKTKETLSKKITEYIESNTETLLPLSKVTIEIDSKSSIDIENFAKCLKIHYGIKILNCKRIDRLATRKKALLLAIALFAFLIGMLVSYTWLKEILSFVGTLSIWELCDILVFSEEEEFIEEYIYEVLEKAEVTLNVQ